MDTTNLIPVAEAAQVLNCSEQFVRQLLREGIIQGQRLKSTWLIDKNTFEPERIELRKNKTNPSDRKSQIKLDSTSSHKKLKALSFFSGAGGLDIGLDKVGIKVLLACEIDKASRRTLITNNPEIGLIG
ncbi:helix-turn-helix domain-containing protein [Rufibacter sp. XAAS-G3-1]|uniref:helix-turn-helix domain-containing protein n=1 Tax=Rufibacter sp. XAAS-G3-1 TaxID=2729134 RepID=UPI0015E66931|nr:helix-turn-helix domain-containing protein [Rufibacter sp. XAAS-G3-1]